MDKNVHRSLTEGSVRDTNIDLLRFFCMIMLSTYHFVNYYASDMVNTSVLGLKAFVIQNFFYAGGRIICNVFMIISAWYLCEKNFKSERVIKTWLTVILYSLFVGVYYSIKTNDPLFLWVHLFPISRAVVWYASDYIAILMISPLLNVFLREKNIRLTKRIVIPLVVGECAISTLFPIAYIKLDTICWFCLLYLYVGLVKKGYVNISFKTSTIFMLIGWFSNLLYYDFYDYIKTIGVLHDILPFIGLNKSSYFVRLSSAPTFLCAIGLFIFFKEIHFKNKTNIGIGKVWGGVLRKIAVASLDIYIVASIESKNAKLAWVDVLFGGYNPGSMIELYGMVLFGLMIGIVIGNIREQVYNKSVKVLNLRTHIFMNIDCSLNRYFCTHKGGKE